MNYSHKVLEFATKAHEGQLRKYGNNIAYITHPEATAKIAVDAHLNNGKVPESFKDNASVEIILSVAYLHDVLEDTNVEKDELHKFLMASVDANHVSIIYDAVLLLTKSKQDFDLFQYLDSIKTNYYAKLVKLADNTHNTSDLKDKKKLDYYRLIRYYLEH